MLIQLFIPRISRISNTIELNFYFGFQLLLSSDLLGFIGSSFDLNAFLGILPTIVALILLILLLVLCNNINKQGLLSIGITSAVLMVVSPIIEQFIGSGVYSFIPQNYYLNILCGLIIVLGLIMTLKELGTPKDGATKVSNITIVQSKPIQPSCGHCGAIIRSGSVFCSECGRKL